MSVVGSSVVGKSTPNVVKAGKYCQQSLPEWWIGPTVSVTSEGILSAVPCGVVDVSHLLVKAGGFR